MAQSWRNARRLGIGLTIFGVLSTSSIVVQAAESGMKELVQEQRKHFMTVYSEWLGTRSQDAVWLKAFIQNLGKEGVNPPPEDWFHALRQLVYLGESKHIFYRSNGFLEDAKTVEILVAALREKEPKIREFALNTLIGGTRRIHLEQFAPAIKDVLGPEPKGDDLLLLVKLPMNEKEKQKVLSQSDLPIEVKARVGDKDAEGELRKQFDTEVDYYKKSSLCRRLGYAGTPGCARALVDALRSSVCVKGPHGDRSIRCDVLIALGHVYQDEPLFTRDARLLADNGDATFDRHRGFSSYLADVDAWVRKGFGHSAWGEGEVWFIRWHNVPIVAPGTIQREPGEQR